VLVVSDVELSGYNSIFLGQKLGKKINALSTSALSTSALRIWI